MYIIMCYKYAYNYMCVYKYVYDYVEYMKNCCTGQRESPTMCVCIQICI